MDGSERRVSGSSEADARREDLRVGSVDCTAGLSRVNLTKRQHDNIKVTPSTACGAESSDSRIEVHHLDRLLLLILVILFDQIPLLPPCF